MKYRYAITASSAPALLNKQKLVALDKKARGVGNDIPRLTSVQRETMVAIVPIIHCLKKMDSECGEGLFSRVKDGRKRIRCAISMLNNVFDDLYYGDDAIPADQKASIQHDLRYVEYKMTTFRGGIKEDEYGHWFSNAQIQELFNATSDKCLMCAANTQEQRQCPLRKVLNSVPMEGNFNDDGKGTCPYLTTYVRGESDV